MDGSTYDEICTLEGTSKCVKLLYIYVQEFTREGDQVS